MRVYELAKEYDKKATDFVDIIQSFGIDVKSHLSSLDDFQIAAIREAIREKEEQPAEFNIGAGNLKGDDCTLGSEDSVVETDTEEIQEAIESNIKEAGRAREKYAETAEEIVKDPENWHSLVATEETKEETKAEEWSKKVEEMADRRTEANKEVEKLTFWGWLKKIFI